MVNRTLRIACVVWPWLPPALWADDQNFLVLQAGLLPFQVPITIPPVGTPRQVLVAQGVLLHQGTCRLSNPVHANVH